MPNQCRHVRASGQRCRARARADRDLCPFHDPETAAAQREARRAGGRERTRRAAVLPPDTPDVPLASVADAVSLLAKTVNWTLRGKLDTKAANSVAYLLTVFFRGLEAGELTERVRRLEEQAAAGRSS